MCRFANSLLTHRYVEQPNQIHRFEMVRVRPGDPTPVQAKTLAGQQVLKEKFYEYNAICAYLMIGIGTSLESKACL